MVDPADVEVLVSTMNRTEPPALWSEAQARAEAMPRLLVINQCTEIAPPAPLVRDGVRMLSFAERGLARSRNRALEAAEGELLMIADDDLHYAPGAVAAVRAAFARFSDAAIVTFRYGDRLGSASARAAARAARRHSRWSIAGVASVEIVLRRSRIGGLRFDTRFGLGASFPSGEEAIFLADALGRGLGVYHSPEMLWTHPGVSSGRAAWDRGAAAARGAVACRMYGPLWPAAVGYLAVTKRAHYRDAMGTAGFVREAVRGARALWHEGATSAGERQSGHVA